MALLGTPPVQPGPSVARQRVFRLTLLLAPVVGLWLLAEVVLRLTSANLYIYDPALGWVARPAHHHATRVTDAGGRTYAIATSTDARGFRAWGDTAGRERIFLVGDSFTDHRGSSDVDAYFGVLQQELGVDVFAVGGNGYGTLQQAMLVERFIDQVRPTTFVLQFCENDFRDNSLEMGRINILRSQSFFRPYLVGDTIVYRRGGLYRFLMRHSLVANRIDARIQAWQFRRYGGHWPRPVGPEAERGAEEALQQSVATTRQLMERIHHLVAPFTLRLFTIDCQIAEEYARERAFWLQIAAEAGFTPLPSVTEAVDQEERAGVVVRAADGEHWNDRGHLIAGRELARQLRASVGVDPR